MKAIPLWLAAIALTAIVSVTAATYYYEVALRGRRTLVASTTTSLYDTGLLEVVKAKFEERYGINIYFIAVGSGQAIQHAMRGDADLILVHAPSTERNFLTSGYGVCRKIFAYNFFAIVGPATDPAGIRALNASAALTNIVNAGRAGEVMWVSRGDESGTHVKEKELWKSAGFNSTLLKEERWFMETGSGMGNTLLVADQKGGYALADIGTYLQYRSKIGLEILIGEEEPLLNVYSAIAVNPAKVSRVNFEDAVTFIKFLTSAEGQDLIENFKKDVYERSLFLPAVNLLKSSDLTAARWIEKYAFFNGTECPPEYRDGHPELYV